MRRSKWCDLEFPEGCFDSVFENPVADDRMIVKLSNHVIILFSLILGIIGWSNGRHAFMTPSVGSRAVIMLSRTIVYVASVWSSFEIAKTRTTERIQILYRSIVSQEYM